MFIETPMTKKVDTQGDDYAPRVVWFCALTLHFGLDAAICRDGARPVSARPVSACPVSAMSLRRRGAPRLYNITAEDSGIEIINR
jgi:hypothetical protein